EFALYDPPRGEGGAVEGETHQPRAGRVAVDQSLLRFDHAGVLGERKISHVLVGVRNIGIVEPPRAHRRPEIVGGALGLRRKAIEHDVSRCAEWKIAARLACAERNARIDWRPELEELPAVDLAVKISRRLVDRSGIDVV